MRPQLLAPLVLLLALSAPNDADAQWTTNDVPLPFNNVEVRCGAPWGMSLADRQQYPSIPDTNDRIDIGVSDQFWPNISAYEAVVLDLAALTRQLDTIRERVHDYCEQVAAETPNWDSNRGEPGIPDSYLIGFHSVTRGNLLAYSPSLTDGWTVLNNDARAEILRQRAFQRAQVAAVIGANRQAQLALRAKQTLQRRFVSQYGVSQWVGDGQLTANPFVFQNQVVAVSARFMRMTARTDALFSGGAPFVVGSVPPTLFRGYEPVVLAVRVVGMRTIETATVPDLRFVGYYRCRANCASEIWPN